MPKAILEFSLPEENEEFDSAKNGGLYKSVLWELDQYLRGRLKYETLPDPIHDALQLTRDKLWELVKDDNLDLG